MRYVLLHARAYGLEMWRQPAYWIPSLGFPLFFFVLFGLNTAELLYEQSGLGSEYVVTPFLLFATLNVTLMSLAGGVATDRASAWERALRLLPVSGVTRFLGRLAFVLLFSLLSWVPVLVVAALTTHSQLPIALWPVWVLTIAVGAIPFGMLGILLGYLLPGQAAAPVANILFMVLSFVGGLFMPAEQLPAFMGKLAPYLPTNEYLHLVLAAIGRSDRVTAPDWTIALLPVWGVLFAFLAHRAFRRDEGERFG